MAITIPILTDFNGGGIDKAVAQFQKLETTGQKAHFVLRKAAIPAGIAIAAVGAAALDAAKAAAEDAAAADKLAGQLKRTAGASDEAAKAAEGFITKLSMQVGVADDELRPALGKLATATGDVTKAQDLLGIALDVSAQTSKPLDQVTTGLAKAYGGNLGALKKLIPGFDEGIIKSKDFAKAQDELAKLTGGAAQESANTASGKFRTLGITLQETKEAVGAALMPAVQAFLPILQRMAQFAQDNSGVMVILAAVVGGLGVAILAVNAYMKLAAAASAIWTAAQWLLNAALEANPLGIIITILAAVAIAIYTAYQKSETFRNIVDALGDVIRSAFGWIRDNVGPILQAFWDKAKSAFGWLRDHAGPILTVFKGLLIAAFAPIFVAVKAMRTLLDLLGSWDKGPRGVPNIRQGGGTGGVTITGPQGATGGIVNRPTFALIGEAGPEAVIPLNQTPGNGPLPAGFGGGMTINVSAGLVATPDQIGQQIIEAIQSAQRRSGPVFAPA
jgi:hypothetical protein